jgi:hypothetical protein
MPRVARNEGRRMQEMLIDQEIDNQEIHKGLLPLKMIWFAMLASLGIYLFVGLHVVSHLKPLLDKNTFEIIKTVFYAAGFVTLIFTRYIRKWVLPGKARHGQPAPASLRPLLQKYTIVMIIALAMSESIGIYGLVLFLMGKDIMDLYLLLFISAAAMFMYRPRKEELIRLFQETRKGATPRGLTA